MNGEFFEPSPELQAEIDEALTKRARRDPSWSPGAGIVLHLEEIRARRSVQAAGYWSARELAVSATSFASVPLSGFTRKAEAERDAFYGARAWGLERVSR